MNRRKVIWWIPRRRNRVGVGISYFLLKQLFVRVWPLDSSFQPLFGPPDMATSCLTCSKTFQTKNAIVDHCRTKGHQSNIIPCITCGQLYQRGVAMENHCRAKRHALVQPSCDICRRQFTSLTDLQAVRWLVCPTVTSAHYDWYLSCSMSIHLIIRLILRLLKRPT